MSYNHADMIAALVSIHETGNPGTSDMFVLAAIQKGSYLGVDGKVWGGYALKRDGKWHLSSYGDAYVRENKRKQSYSNGTYRKRKHKPHSP